MSVQHLVKLPKLFRQTMAQRTILAEVVELFDDDTEKKSAAVEARELLIAVQTHNVNKRKLLLEKDSPARKKRKCQLNEVDSLNVQLVRALSEKWTGRMMAKGYETIIDLIERGAQLVGGDDDINSNNFVYNCLFKFITERVEELGDHRAASRILNLEDAKELEFDLVQVLKLLTTHGEADAAFTKIIQNPTIARRCCETSSLGARPETPFPLLRFFLDRGLDTDLCEDALNESLCQDWEITTLLLEFGANAPLGWELQKYLRAFQNRYPNSKAKIEKGLQLRRERQKLIFNHLFQSISPACQLMAPSFDVTPLCAIIAEYYLQL